MLLINGFLVDVPAWIAIVKESLIESDVKGNKEYLFFKVLLLLNKQAGVTMQLFVEGTLLECHS